MAVLRVAENRLEDTLAPRKCGRYSPLLAHVPPVVFPFVSVSTAAAAAAIGLRRCCYARSIGSCALRRFGLLVKFFTARGSSLGAVEEPTRGLQQISDVRTPSGQQSGWRRCALHTTHSVGRIGVVRSSFSSVVVEGNTATWIARTRHTCARVMHA
jgi:hypothetical protein